MARELPTAKIQNIKTGTVHEGWLYEDDAAINHLACGSNGVNGPAKRGFRVVTSQMETTCKRCIKAVAAILEAPEAVQEAKELEEAVEAAAALEAPTYTITVRYRINKPPFEGMMFLVPMITQNKLLGDIRRELRQSLNLAADELSVIQIQVLEDPEALEEIPLGHPTVSIAPGIYFRPLFTESGMITLYTLHWARLIDRGLVYSIRRQNSPGAVGRREELGDATLAEVHAFLRETGLTFNQPS